MLCEPELTFLRNVSEKVFSDKAALLETQVLADNKTNRTQVHRSNIKYFLQVLCTALILYRWFDGNAAYNLL